MPVGLRKIQAVLVKLESSEGQDALPVAADAVQLVEPGTIVPGAEMIHARPDLVWGGLDESGPLPPGAKWAELTFRIYVRGKGAAYTTTAGPEAHAMIQAAGMQADFSTGLWDYDSQWINQKTATLYAFQGLDTGVYLKHVLLGAMASRLGYVARGGGVGFFEATFRGKYVAPTDIGAADATYFTTVPPTIGAAASVSIGGYSGKVSEVRSTIENTLAARISANDSDGLFSFRVVNRRLAWSLALEAVRVSDYDVFGKWAGGTAEQLTVTHGAVANNRFTVSAAKATILDPPVYRERDGLVDFFASGVCGPEGVDRMRWRFD